MCKTLLQMSVPAEIKRYLKISAFDKGVSMTEYVVALIEKDMKEKENNNE